MSQTIAKCCECGRSLTQWDYEHETMIVEEVDTPYTEQIEVFIYCSDCYDYLYPNEEDELGQMEE